MAARFASEPRHAGGGPDRDIGRFREFVSKLASRGVPGGGDGARGATQVMAFDDSEVLCVQYRPANDVVAAVPDDGMMTVSRDAAAGSVGRQGVGPSGSDHAEGITFRLYFR